MPQKRLVLKVSQHTLAIMDRLDMAQGYVEKGLQVVFFAAGRDGGDNLVQIQVGEALGDARPSATVLISDWLNRMLRKGTDIVTPYQAASSVTNKKPPGQDAPRGRLSLSVNPYPKENLVGRGYRPAARQAR